EMRDRLEIGQMISSTTYKTGLSDFAIVQLPNVQASGNIHGRDDYTPIDPIIMELISRVGQIAKILDKHASPSMEAPDSAFQVDNDTGEYTLKAGDAFIRNSKEDAETRYITWDGNLEAAFKEFDMLLNQLYSVSEMGAAIFGDLKGSIPPSGAALRRLMVNPLMKVGRIRNHADPVVKKIIALLSEVTPSVSGLKRSDIEIQWQDGLPNDPLEEAQIMNLRVQAPTMSATTAMQRYDNMGIEQAEEELGRIQEQALTANPVLTSAVNENKEV
ncbi:phage portal protein, partial [Pelosinus propionicus]